VNSSNRPVMPSSDTTLDNKVKDGYVFVPQ
jgi:hypothetical protein